MNISAANLGITLGAVAGGWVVERWDVIVQPGILPLLVGPAGARWHESGRETEFCNGSDSDARIAPAARPEFLR